MTKLCCGFCGEPVLPGERAPIIGGVFHDACNLRLIVGSVAHQQRRCGCFVKGSTESDPPGLTLREAARAAVDLFRRLEQQEAWPHDGAFN